MDILTKLLRVIINHEEFWNRIRNLIRAITKNSDDYDEKYMKIKFNWDDDLTLNKTTKIHNATIVFKAVFKKITNIVRKFS